jgi:hypothetical protein
MRKIYISDGMGYDERLLELSSGADGARIVLLWPWVLLSLDDWGRGSGNPAIVKAKVAPAFDALTREDFASALRAFVRVGLLMSYVVDGSTYICVDSATWWRYQTHIPRERRDSSGSRFPAPSDGAPVEISAPAQIERDSAETRGDARDLAQNRSSLSLSLSLPLSPSTRSARSRRPPRERGDDAQAHPNAELMAVFAEAFGDARTPSEQRRRALAANDLRAGGATADEVRRAISRWASVYPGATCTPHAIAAHLTTLLAAPPARTSSGTVDATRAWLDGGMTHDSHETGIRRRDEPIVGGISTATVDDGGRQKNRTANVLGGTGSVIVVNG